jgi:4-amino-4-deoxy-L-arabinose transferase-like glycosyltransferase
MSLPAIPSDKTADWNQILREPRFQLALLILLAITFYFSKLGGNGLANWDDCYYAHKAKEILRTGDWLTMHYNGTPAFDNPPFYLWLLVVAYKIFGVTEYAAKFPSALMGVAAVALTFALARRLFNAWIGFLSGVVLATTTVFNKYARHAMMDVALTFFVTLALFSLMLALQKDKRYFLLWGFCISICILIKSVLGIFPLLISVLFLAVTRRFNVFLTWQFWSGSLIIAALGGAWYVHQYLNHGQDFIDVHFRWLILQRGFSIAPQPWFEHFSYFKDLLTYYWPWLPLCVIGLIKLLKQSRQQNESALLLLIWISAFLVILSLMQSRKVWYIMPIFPAMAMVSALAMAPLFSEKGKLIFSKVIFALWLVALLLINATPLQVESQREKDVRLIAPYVRHFGEARAKIIAFRISYQGLNNALLFYSDYAAFPIYEKTTELAQAFQDSTPVLCIAKVPDMAELESSLNELYVIRRGEKIILLSNRALDASGVKIW